MLHSLLLSLLIQTAPAAPPTETRTISQAFHVGDEATWVFEIDGKRVGHHVSRYLGQDELAGVKAHHFQGRVRLEAEEIGELRNTADLWVDDRGHPVRFTQQALVGDTYSRVDLDVAGDQSKARIVQGPTPREMTVKVDPDAYLLANNFISHLEIVLALRARGEDAKLKLFSGNSLQGLSYSLKAKGKFDDEIGGKKRNGNVYDDSLGEHLRFADGRLIDVEMKLQKLVIKRSDEKFDPFTISPPELRKVNAAFDNEDVRITYGDASIAGTVTKKKGSTGRLPAVFFVSGSGQQDRNGYSSGLDIGTHEILDRLTSDGFLVLRVDDRGAGESSALPAEVSFDDLIADARACVDFLMKRDDVDPKRVALIGHSEGGETVPILAAERAEIAAVVLMAAPGRSILDVIADQNRLALEKSRLARDAIEAKMKEVRAFLAKLASDEPIDPKSLSDEERASLDSRAWMRSHAKHDPIATIKRVHAPILVLQGGKDFQVSPERDAVALEAALKDAHHADHELHLFAGLDHLFKKSPGERSEYADYWKSRPVDAEFLDALSTWLTKRLKLDAK